MEWQKRSGGSTEQQGKKGHDSACALFVRKLQVPPKTPQPVRRVSVLFHASIKIKSPCLYFKSGQEKNLDLALVMILT